MAKRLHWGWLILAYLLGGLFPVSKLPIIGGIIPKGL